MKMGDGTGGDDKSDDGVSGSEVMKMVIKIMMVTVTGTGERSQMVL